MSALMHRSTGTTSAWFLSSHIMERSTPLPEAMRMPVGPLKLSTQPGMGSRSAAVTIDGLAIDRGILVWYSSTRASASCLVNV